MWGAGCGGKRRVEKRGEGCGGRGATRKKREGWESWLGVDGSKGNEVRGRRMAGASKGEWGKRKGCWGIKGRMGCRAMVENGRAKKKGRGNRKGMGEG
ncbi:hypothetical protein GOBAR_AA10087 [Gossypium barbadense]|uniref:Uncharacterized protein n=1 Tax=Gossypium barbadense TaxID=3634 RepID=A0A2P5Y4N7_GOSBA|nr:hypothetical protein GOBAR_AA10087 [Gossypium barbadense]